MFFVIVGNVSLVQDSTVTFFFQNASTTNTEVLVSMSDTEQSQYCLFSKIFFASL